MTTISRNARCPCGSGRKFKHCCGALPLSPEAGPTISAAMPPAARSLLVRGLRHQIDAEFEAACELYRAALVAAPGDPEILHMLAIAEYSLHDMAGAKVHGREARAAARAAARDAELDAIGRSESYIEAALECRRLRPVVFDPAVDRHPPAAVPDTIHIIQTYVNPAGGSEWHAIHLGERLARQREVRYWAEGSRPSPAFEPWGVQAIDVPGGRFPRTGTLVIIGCFFPIGAWLAETEFRRIILCYNIMDPRHLARRLESLARPGLPRVEIDYASDLLGRNAGLPGTFDPSPIDLALLDPAAATRRGDAKFTVGRLSRDVATKFDSRAPEFFAAVAASGVRVRIMGGTVLADALGDVRNIELLPERAESVAQFLRSLDVFVYRTHSTWPEAWGRVVSEAMAVGLPVVVHANGGYAQIIRHGENGFVFHRDCEALDLVATLRQEPALRARIGAAARQTATDLLGEEGYARFVEFFLR